MNLSRKATLAAPGHGRPAGRREGNPGRAGCESSSCYFAVIIIDVFARITLFSAVLNAIFELISSFCARICDQRFFCISHCEVYRRRRQVAVKQFLNAVQQRPATARHTRRRCPVYSTGAAPLRSAPMGRGGAERSYDRPPCSGIMRRGMHHPIHHQHTSQTDSQIIKKCS